jgi:D-alanyl-D-alanine carboxypeptidase (penicillin-binding protein 5/6)
LREKKMVKGLYCSWLVALLLAGPMFAQEAAKKSKAKSAAEKLDGPPIVSAKSWAIADGKTGQFLWGFNENESRPMASTTKIMTAYVVLKLAEKNPKVLDETVTFSERAATTVGSSAKLQAGEKLPARELLYGLMLPSGNDAAVAFAEHFGDRFKNDEAKGDNLERFVAEMNREAQSLGMKQTSYLDPNGLSNKNVSSTHDLTVLSWNAMKNPEFRKYVSTRDYEYEVTGPKGKRKVTWENTNRLLEMEGYDGIKTGTTTPAGSCLAARGEYKGDQLIIVVLGSTSNDGRYADVRNLFRWAWTERSKATNK